MVTIMRWTGREARALRDGLRMSVRAFAVHTNLSVATIADMEAKGDQTRLRNSTQQILDGVLADASEEARKRFYATVEEAALRPRSVEPTDGAGPAPTDVGGEPDTTFVAHPADAGAAAPDGYGLADSDADESLRSAVQAWSQAAPEAALEQMWLQVRTLAQEYSSTPAPESLSRARRVRDLGLQVLEGTRRPGQVQQLYLGVGHACALMGIASFDMLAFAAAQQQATAAYLFGEMAGHNGLCAWARGLEAQTAFWRGRPTEAVRLGTQAVAMAPAGTAQARMLCILARAFSHLGDAQQTRKRLLDAQRVRDSLSEAGTDELHDEFGGPFGWGPARHAACASNALLRIGDADAAVDQARLAIALHDADRTGTLVDARAHADIAAAELTRGQLDAAHEALERVWQVPPPLRRYGLLGRLEHITTVLTEPQLRGSPVVGELQEHIGEFAGQAPVPRALPAGTG